MPIEFYNSIDPYGQFSNFYGITEDKNFKLALDGRSWRTTEHYFQSQKFRGQLASKDSLDYADKIAETNTPGKSACLARQKLAGQFSSTWVLKPKHPEKIKDLINESKIKGIKIRPDWEEIKDDVMLKALYAKFGQNPKLFQLLRDTDNKQLVEHTSRDSYWGDGGDGSGLNKLGKMLMIIRNGDENLNTDKSQNSGKTKIPIKVKTPIKTPIKTLIKIKIPLKKKQLHVSEIVPNGMTIIPTIEDKYLIKLSLPVINKLVKLAVGCPTNKIKNILHEKQNCIFVYSSSGMKVVKSLST